jgi:tetratricopeptide (TPR) repeat protein
LIKSFGSFECGALAGKGKVRAAQNDLETAVQLYEKLNKRTAEPERAIFLGDIYKKIGKDSESKKTYDAIIKKQRESKGDMHRIALFWADNNINLEEALKIAREDRKNNADLLSSDTLAWCLYKTGNYTEAKRYITEAMRLKTKNALFYYHAGMIEKALGNKGNAIKYLKLSFATNPSFDLLQSEIAKTNLAQLESR